MGALMTRPFFCAWKQLQGTHKKKRRGSCRAILKKMLPGEKFMPAGQDS